MNTLEEVIKLAIERGGPYPFDRVSMDYHDNLALLSYTQESQRAGIWSYPEWVCRGLIIDHETGEVVARQFGISYQRVHQIVHGKEK